MPEPIGSKVAAEGPIIVPVFLFRLSRTPLPGEKILQQFPAIRLPDAARDFTAVIQRGELQQVHRPAGRAALGSLAPNTTRASRVCTIAPAHIGQGSLVT